MSQQCSKLKKRRILAAFFAVSFIVTLCLSNVELATKNLSFGTVVLAQNSNASQLVNTGIKYYDRGEFKQAVKDWETALKIYQNNKQKPQQAIVQGNLARAYQKLGDLEQTVKKWQQVVFLHQQLQNPGETGRALTELAQAYSSLGQPKKAIELLCGLKEKTDEKFNFNCFSQSALGIANSEQDARGKVVALGSLGEAYRQLTNYELAIKYLQEAKKISGVDGNSLIFNSLGNVYLSQAFLWSLRAESAQKSRPDKYNEFTNQAKSTYKLAEKSFRDSLQIAENQKDTSTQMKTALNLIQLYSRSRQLNLVYENKSDQIVQKALTLLDKLPDSAQKVYAAIDLANLPGENITTLPLTQCAANQKPSRKLALTEVDKLLNQAVKIADNIQDFRAKSFALGARGHFYECQGNYNQALDLTRQALIIADQNLKSKDSLYLWEWQTGRLLLKKGDESKAIDAYERAFQTLEKIRTDILTANKDFQLDFRDIIQPIYRKLAELKLAQTDQNFISGQFQQKANKQDNISNELNDARDIIDSLRLAELQNYFGNECILAAIKQQQVDQLLGDNTAVFSSVILENRAAIFLNLPGGKSYVQWIKQENGKSFSIQQLNKLIRDFRQGLVNAPLDFEYDIQQAANLYQLLIKPFEEYINPEIIKTFVFVQDGFFRSIPMAALYDSNNKKYLIEKFAIANTPSLRLTAPKKLDIRTSRALITAVNQAANIDGQKYRALSNVDKEIKSVQKIFPKTETLYNENFTLDNIKEKLDETVYPIIHIATHAQFGIIPEDTYLVAGNNQKLTISELEKVLRQFSGGVDSIELLSLTACQTAVGDERATLGLAGIALQVGVRSALASLWSLPDESTSILVEEFYQNLLTGKTKAEALQQAQIKLLQAKKLDNVNNQYDNPGYWAPFIMIGNWL
jgi:CHAT domain-containing protein